MNRIYNPFQPNTPVFQKMFTWRESEIDSIDQALFQTKNWNPNNILLIWERWIWKTSLLSHAKKFSQWEVNSWPMKYNFLSVQVILTDNTTLLDLAKKITKSIEREFKSINPELDVLKKTWDFISRLSIAWVSLKQSDQSQMSNEEFIDEFIHSLIDTVKWITEDNLYQEMWLNEKKDGIVLLIDEWDKANKDLDLWVFLKTLSEKLNIESANKLLIIMAWLPKVREVLRESHQSSLRIFNELILPPLTKEEISELSQNAIIESNNATNWDLTITKEACADLFGYSEGYPHFAQQIGYSAFEANTDNEISGKDVMQWFFWENWALDRIWKRYYDTFYYRDISSKSHREILSILAKQWNTWSSIKKIKKDFKGNDNTLKSWLSALVKKNIILKNEKEKWEYRLQWWSFAFWIHRINKRKKV